MRLFKWFLAFCVFVVLPLLAGFAVLHFGLLPAKYSPIAPLELSEPKSWFLDWRIEQLRYDKTSCRKLLQPPHIRALPRQDFSGAEEGCGWVNGYTVMAASGAKLGPSIAMTCPLSAAFSLWVEHIVQPTAMRLLNSHVTSIQHFGGYSCRNIRSSRTGRFIKMKSEHAKANAIDIAGFKLANGQLISVLKHWPGKDARAEFLHHVYSGACDYFRVTLGPDANALHRNHFHFDRGPFRACR